MKYILPIIFLLVACSNPNEPIQNELDFSIKNSTSLDIECITLVTIGNDTVHETNIIAAYSTSAFIYQFDEWVCLNVICNNTNILPGYLVSEWMGDKTYYKTLTLE